MPVFESVEVPNGTWSYPIVPIEQKGGSSSSTADVTARFEPTPQPSPYYLQMISNFYHTYTAMQVKIVEMEKQSAASGESQKRHHPPI